MNAEVFNTGLPGCQTLFKTAVFFIALKPTEELLDFQI